MEKKEITAGNWIAVQRLAGVGEYANEWSIETDGKEGSIIPIGEIFSNEADARLAASAPDLLKALKNMHAKALKGTLKTLGDLNEAEDAMRKAVAL